MLLALCFPGCGRSSSPSDNLGVDPRLPGSVDVLTYHNDLGRTGANLAEKILTPASVSAAEFGILSFLPTDGLVDAEPLYVSNLRTGDGVHNVLYVATENDSIYAFDADTLAPLWKSSLAGNGEMAGDDHGCNQIAPRVGITSTPVIDPAAGHHGTIFAVAMSRDALGRFHQRIHALDLVTGYEQPGSPSEIQAKYPGRGSGSVNGVLTFDPAMYKERAALLLLDHTIYTTWASHCDVPPYSSWVIAYDEFSLTRKSVLDLTANGSTQGGQEGAIWMSGSGPAADSLGFIYLLVGNGTFDESLDGRGFPKDGNFGNAFIKLARNGNRLAVADYFAAHNALAESNADTDLGSGGAIVIPDVKDSKGNTHRLAVGAGKDATIYVVDRTAMGKFNRKDNDAIYQHLEGALSPNGGVFGKPAYFNNTVYYGAVDDNLKSFPICDAKLVATAASQTAASFGYPGTIPAISANGATNPPSNGIVWAIQNADTGVLHAYDASNLGRELYNSNQAGLRDHFAATKFVTPMIADGKVFAGTPSGVVVFGLLDSPTAKLIRWKAQERAPQVAATRPHRPDYRSVPGH